MALDIDRILRETFIVQAEHLPSVSSTNDRAAERALRADALLPLLVTADQQTAGRGRGANRWWTGAGALAFSVAVEPEMIGADRGPAPLVSLAVGVAVVDAIAPLLDLPVGLHWPNDVLAAERKVAGILVEVLPNRRHVIGIGVNTNNTMVDAPDELRQRATTLRDLLGRPCDSTATLVAILNHLAAAFAVLRSEPREIAARANELCLQWGRTLTLDHGGRTVVGRCQGIAEDGALRLETPAGIEIFHSGVLRKTY